MAYVAGIGKRDSSKCMYCDSKDDAEHTLFDCMKWKNLREELTTTLGKTINVDNIISIMLQSKENWDNIGKYVENIISIKESDHNFQEKARKTLKKRKKKRQSVTVIRPQGGDTVAGRQEGF